MTNGKFDSGAGRIVVPSRSEIIILGECAEQVTYLATRLGRSATNSPVDSREMVIRARALRDVLGDYVDLLNSLIAEHDA